MRKFKEELGLHSPCILHIAEFKTYDFFAATCEELYHAITTVYLIDIMYSDLCNIALDDQHERYAMQPAEIWLSGGYNLHEVTQEIIEAIK